jgi:uncharacterized protein (DUF488 family)
VRESNQSRVFTIGHSNHPIEHFLELLRRHSIEAVVDTRSQPYSKFAPQYNQAALEESLASDGFHYLYLGRELGGRPKGDEYYDSEGRVLYDRVASSELFLQGLDRLDRGLQTRKIAILCAEENPANCHRHLLIGRALAGNGISIGHIRGDGRIQSEEEIAAQPSSSSPQMTLFSER